MLSTAADFHPSPFPQGWCGCLLWMALGKVADRQHSYRFKMPTILMTQFCFFLWLSNIYILLIYIYIYSIVYIYHIFSIRSSVDGHLDCFHVLAIVNSVAMNIGGVCVILHMVFSGYMPQSGIAGSYDCSIFSF